MVVVFILIVLLIVALIIALQGLIYWGIGCFVIWVFHIPYTWTFLHGIAVGLIVSALTGIFKREVIIKND